MNKKSKLRRWMKRVGRKTEGGYQKTRLGIVIIKVIRTYRILSDQYRMGSSRWSIDSNTITNSYRNRD